jgi:hypothetical protein
MISNERILVHVFDINFAMLPQSEKYIQMSSDQKIVSVPNNDKINIFDVDELINNHILKLHTENKIVPHKINEIFKCLLCNDMYIIIYISDNKYVITSHYFFNNAQPKIINLDVPIDRCHIFFSQNCNNLLIFDTMHEKIKTINLKNFCEKEMILKGNVNKIITNTIALSDDGNLITFLTSDNRLVLVDDRNELEVKEYGTKLEITRNDVFNMTSTITRHKDFINIQSNTAIKNIYSLLIRITRDTALNWNILEFSNGYFLSDQIRCNFLSQSSGNTICIDKLLVYDANSIVPLTLIDAVLSVLKDNMDTSDTIGNTYINNELIIKDNDYEEVYNVSNWVLNLLGLNVININNLKDLNIPMFKYNFKNSNELCCTTFQLLLIFLQDHHKMNKYINIIYDQYQENKVDYVVNMMLKILEGFVHDRTTSLRTQYIEYLLIKFVLLFHYNKTEIDIKKMVKLCRHLRMTRLFLLKSLKMTFKIDITHQLLLKS